MAVLKITSGELAGQTVNFEQDEISIGRSAQNIISLDDTAVSGKHCVVVRNGKKFSIRDLNSTNGTRLNGRIVTESRLSPGDVIMVGAVEIAIEGSDVEAEEKPESRFRDGPVPTVIMTPRSAAAVAPPPPSFKKRRDNRPLIIIASVISVLLVLAAAAFFLMKVLK